jgi:glucose-6-phosphate 1-epimerase
VLATHAHADGSTELRLGFSNDATTQALWPHAFTLELHISIGSTLKLALVMRNTDTTAWSCTGALHSYLAVGDIGAVTIDGLDTVAYVDKVAGGQLRRQEGPIVIDTEVDRVYQETTATCRIDDTAFARQITIAKAGSHSTVVWNPWQAKAAQLADMADDEYRAFVCVETTNAGDDIVTLAPGAEHRLELTLAQD